MGGTEFMPDAGSAVTAAMGVSAVFMIIYFLIIGLSLLMSVAIYILDAIGVMTIAKNRGITKPWMAWIPFANSYLFGKLSDDINFCKGKRTNHRKLLLGLLIAAEIVVFVGYIVMVVGVVTAGFVDGMRGGEELIAFMPFIMLIGWAIMMVGAIIAIVHSVFHYIALYNILNTYAPNLAIVILLLTILVFSPLSSIYLFAIRNKTPIDAMPPVQNGYQPTPPEAPQAPMGNEGYRIYPPQEPVAPQYQSAPQSAVSQPTEVLSQPTEVLSQPTEVLSDPEE